MSLINPDLGLSPFSLPSNLHSYNRPEDDFATREEFDNYLEQREDLSEFYFERVFASLPFFAL